MLAERVDHRGVGVGHEQHVRLLDLLEAPDRRAVEPEALLEDVLGQLVGGHREVLHEAGQVDEPDVDDLDALVLHQAEHFRRGPLLHGSSLVASARRRGLRLPARSAVAAAPWWWLASPVTSPQRCAAIVAGCRGQPATVGFARIARL